MTRKYSTNHLVGTQAHIFTINLDTAIRDPHDDLENQLNFQACLQASKN